MGGRLEGPPAGAGAGHLGLILMGEGALTPRSGTGITTFGGGVQESFKIELRAPNSRWVGSRARLF